MEPAAEFVNDLEVCNASGRFVVFHSTTLAPSSRRGLSFCMESFHAGADQAGVTLGWASVQE